MASDIYQFRPMTMQDLPLLRHWLAVPHVAQWWGEPDQQFALVSADLDHPAMDQYIIAMQDRPLGYLQCYQLSAWNSGFGSQPQDTRGIDLFIGEADMIGCGHGAALIHSFVAGLLATGTPRVVTDPAPVNARAIRAYEKAGFQRERIVDTPDGIALLMACDSRPATHE
jgi:aminoglycoside 6'-N-acetyltransferase